MGLTLAHVPALRKRGSGTQRLGQLPRHYSCHAFCVYSLNWTSSVRGPILFPLYPVFCETNRCVYVWVNYVSKDRFRRWLHGIQQYLRTVRRPPIRIMCLSQYHQSSHARDRTLSVGVLESSGISLSVFSIAS